MTDFIVQDHGTIVILTPQTPEAQGWADEHLPDDARWFGNGIAIAHRYFEDIYHGITAGGLTIS